MCWPLVPEKFQERRSKIRRAASGRGPSCSVLSVLFFSINIGLIRESGENHWPRKQNFNVNLSREFKTLNYACLLKAINRRFETNAISVVCQAIDPRGRLVVLYLTCRLSRYRITQYVIVRDSACLERGCVARVKTHKKWTVWYL